MSSIYNLSRGKSVILSLMNQKRIAPILIVILITATILGGYLIYQKQTQPSLDPQYSISIDRQNNLKTYTNKKAGFSVQYPINYQDSAGDDFLTLDDKKISKMNSDCIDRPNFRIELYIEPTTEVSAQDIAQKRKNDDKTWAGEIIKQSEIVVSSIQASTTEWRLGKCQDGVSIDIVHNGYHIEIDKYPPKGQENEFNQILSTFKFLDQTSVDSQFCGGIANIECSTDYKCQLDGSYPDAGGKCVK